MDAVKILNLLSGLCLTVSTVVFGVMKEAASQLSTSYFLSLSSAVLAYAAASLFAYGSAKSSSVAKVSEEQPSEPTDIFILYQGRELQIPKLRYDDTDDFPLACLPDRGGVSVMKPRDKLQMLQTTGPMADTHKSGIPEPAKYLL